MEEKFEIVVELLSLLKKNLKILEDKIEAIGGRVETLGSACRTGFLQVRDACHVFREELSEASGTIIQESWN